jgi:DNA helicase IV
MRKANDTRAVVREQLVELAWRVHSSTRGAELSERESFESELRASPSFKAAVDTIWPARNPAGVLRRLYANRGARHRASNGVLSSDEQDLLARRPSQRVSEERWTRGDLALLDELEDLIGGIIQSYGHIVVDEAQDLSAMELRMIARRARRGSMTVLGDLAQSTSPAAQTRWEDAVVHLSAPQVQIAELTVGYRVPASIMELANRLIPEIAPDLAPTSSVRDSGEAPRLVRVAPEQLAASAASLVERLAQVWVSIAVVVPGSLIGEVATALTAAGVSFVDGQARAALGEHVTLLPPLATKGLEFDAVLVVEPARVVAESPSGKGLLYVVLTRAVQHLTVLHAEPLPEAIA